MKRRNWLIKTTAFLLGAFGVNTRAQAADCPSCGGSGRARDGRALCGTCGGSGRDPKPAGGGGGGNTGCLLYLAAMAGTFGALAAIVVAVLS